jgi:hypothetical protein
MTSRSEEIIKKALANPGIPELKKEPAPTAKPRSYDDVLQDRKRLALEKLEVQQMENDLLKEEIFHLRLQAVREGNADYSSLFHHSSGVGVSREELKEELKAEFEERQRMFDEGYARALAVMESQQEAESGADPSVESTFLSLVKQKIAMSMQMQQAINAIPTKEVEEDGIKRANKLTEESESRDEGDEDNQRVDCKGAEGAEVHTEEVKEDVEIEKTAVPKIEETEQNEEEEQK